MAKKAESLSKGEETRRRIIETSAPVFNRLGFGNTAMSDLMEATGLEKGGLYRHFESKEDLACAAFDYAVAEGRRLRFVSVEEQPSALSRVESFIRSFATVRSTVPGGCPIFNTAVESDDGHTPLKKKAREAYLDWVSSLTDLLREARSAGEVEKSLRPEETAHYLLCAVEGALIAANLTGQKEILVNQTKRLVASLKTKE